MWIRDDRIRSLTSVENVSELGNNRRRTGIRCIDVQPHRVLFANRNNFTHRIDARRRPDSRADTERQITVTFVFADGFSKRPWLHAKLRVSRNLAHSALAQAE